MAKVSQNISSDSIFHFIKRRDWLLRILKDKAFKARYVYEELVKDKGKYLLPFDHSDFIYIFLQQEDDVDKVIEAIRKIKIHHHNKTNRKIITARQIERDF